MDISTTAGIALAANSSLSKLKLSTALLKQRNEAEQALVQAIAEASDTAAQNLKSTSGRLLDITV